MRKFAAVLVVLASLSVLSQAQSHSSNDKWEVFAGYTLSRQYGMFNFYSLNENNDSDFGGDIFAPFNQNGGQVAVSYFPTAHFGVTYQMSFLVTGDRDIEGGPETMAINTQRYMIGPAFRYTFNGGASRTTLFAHQLFGASHDSVNDDAESINGSSNGVTLASGGGVDFRLTRHISVRPAQLDYVMKHVDPNIVGLFGDTTGESLKLGVNGFDYSAGAVVRF